MGFPDFADAEPLNDLASRVRYPGIPSSFYDRRIG